MAEDQVHVPGPEVSGPLCPAAPAAHCHRTHLTLGHRASGDSVPPSGGDLQVSQFRPKPVIRARQIHYRRGCPVGNQPLKYGCPVLNLVARGFSQISKYKNIKYVSM